MKTNQQGTNSPKAAPLWKIKKSIGGKKSSGKVKLPSICTSHPPQ